MSLVNIPTAWKEFKSNKFRKSPVFHYRMLPADPDLLKRKLYNIPIEEIDDPTMGYLFRDKRIELDKMLSMLNERDTEDFLLGSIRLYGDTPEPTLRQADEILELFPVNTDREKKMIGRDEFISMAKRELRYLKDQYQGVETEIEISDSVSGLLVNKGKLIINKNFRIERGRAEGIVQHEIGTHVLTYYNGAQQPLQLLRSGVPGYESLQEGLAVLAEYLKINQYPEKLLIGKIRQDYLPVIDELIERRILNPVKIKPRYLRDPLSGDKINRLKKFNKVTDLIKEHPI